MTNTIKLKRGTSTPTTSNISNGEVAIDTSNQKLYINDSGTVKEIGGGGSIGGSSGIDFDDNVKVRFGTGNDFSLYHDGSDSWIKNDTGALIIRGSGGTSLMHLEPKTDENGILVKSDGEVSLWYDNSKKLETSSTGATVTGIFNVTGGELYLGTADSSSGHINAYENMTFSIDTDNDDTNRTFKFLYNSASGSGTTILELNESGNVQIPNDSGKLQLGTSQDLELYHNGSHSYIADVGTGNLALGASILAFHNPDFSETMALFSQSGAAILHYDNVAKLETSSAGITVTGDVALTSSNSVTAGSFVSTNTSTAFTAVDGAVGYFGTGLDLRVYHTGTESWIKNTTGDLIIRNEADPGDVYIQAGGAELGVKVIKDGAVELYYDNIKRLETTSGGVLVSAPEGGDANLYFYADEGDDNADKWLIQAESDGFWALKNYTSGSWEKSIEANGDGNVELYYDNSKKFETGSYGFGTSANIRLLVDDGSIQFGADQDFKLYHDGNYNIIKGEGAHSTQFWTSNTARWRIQAGGHIMPEASHTYDIGTTSSGVRNVYLADSGQLQLGTSQDLKIYHDGTDNYWETSSGTTHFRVASGNRISINGTSGDVSMQGSSGKNFLWDVSAAYLNLNDNAKATYGTDNDLQIYHDGTNTHLENTTGVLNLRNSANIVLAKAHAEVLAVFTPDGGNELYYDAVKKLETTTSGATVIGNLITTANLEPANNIHLLDGKKLLAGASNDLQIYHSGVWNYIQGADTNLAIQAKTDENSIVALPDAEVQLYYDNSEKAATYENGFKVLGDFWLDNPTNAGKDIWFGDAENKMRFYDDVKASFGSSDDLQIYHDGSNSYIQDVGAGQLKLDASYLHIRNYANSNTMANFIGDGQVELYHNNHKSFQTHGEGIRVNGPEGTSADIHLYADEGDDNADKWKISSDTSGNLSINNYTSGSWETNLKTTGNGNVKLYYDNSQKLTTSSIGIEVTGNVHVNDSDKFTCGDSADLHIYHDGGNSWVKDAGTGALYLDGSAIKLTHGGATETLAAFYENGAAELWYDGAKHFETTSTGVSWGTTRLRCADNGMIEFGTGQDLQIYADGSNSYISHNGDGNLRIFSGGVESIRCTEAGATHLFHNGTEMMYTHSAGIKLNDSKEIYLGTGNDLQIYHNGTDSEIKGNTGSLTIKNANNLNLYTAVNEEAIVAVANERVELYYNGSKKFETTSVGVLLNDDTKVLLGNSADMEIYHNGSDNIIYSNKGDLKIISEDDITAIKVSEDGTVDIGHQADNIHLRLGAGSDLKLYHNGTNSYLDNDTGSLDVLSDSFRVANAANSEWIAKFTANGSVELRYDDSKKFETYQYGVKSTGHVACVTDGYGFYSGADFDLELRHDGSHGYIKNITNYLYYRSTQHLFENAAGNELQAKFGENSSVDLYYDNSKKIETVSDGVKLPDDSNIQIGSSSDLTLRHNGSHSYITNTTGQLQIQGNGDDVVITAADDVLIKTQSDHHAIECKGDGPIDLYYDGSKKFETRSGGLGIFGHAELGDNDKVMFGDSNDLKIWHDGGNAKTVCITGNYHSEAPNGLYNYRPTGTAGHGITHWQSDVGGTAAVKAYVKADGDYHNASDYRLKQDIVEINNGIATVKQLKPSTFRWKADTSQTKYGFIAHELQEVVPDIVTGEKDGAETQFVCKESLIAVLAAALKESIAKIETLETKVLALESA